MIENSLDAPEMYPTIRSRAETLQAAFELGIRIPRTSALASEQELADRWSEFPAVLKLDGTWGGTGVEIAHSPGEALAVFRRLAKPFGALALKRILLNRDPSALWSLHSHETPRITIQKYIPGRPANTMFACSRGEVMSIVTVEVVCTHGASGPGTVVRLIKNAEIEEAVRLIARRFRLNGFHGLDFILEPGTGAAYLIELNPRCTQLGHLQLPGQGDLAGVLIAKLTAQDPPAVENPIACDTIAFFPQAFSLNPKSPYLHRCYHDVPWEEPELVRELLREPWPARQFAARFYRFFRSQERHEVAFDKVVPEIFASDLD
jgi:predicted ATP-grasp superfamily ATP-dependent carboligase